MIRAILFDFGRVISAQKQAQLFHSYETQLGLARDSINRIMFDSPLWEQALVGGISMSAYWQAIGPELNLQNPSAIKSFQKRYYEDERINENVLKLLHQLHGSYKLAILSNHPAGLTDWLIDWDIAKLFDTIFCSGDEGVAKPDPQAYFLTLERLGVKPEEAVFIDDTKGHVEAAKEIGLSGIVFTDYQALRIELTRLIQLAK